MDEWIYVVLVQSKDSPNHYAVPVVATSALDALDAASKKWNEEAPKLRGAGAGVAVEATRLIPWHAHVVDPDED